MRHRRLNALRAIPLLLAVALGACWARSHRTADWLYLPTRDRTGGLTTMRGRLFIWCVPRTMFAPPSAGAHTSPFNAWDRHVWFGPQVSVVGFGYGHSPRSGTLVCVPFWLPCFATAAVGVWCVRRRREQPGLCRSCGYDLRASPGRCPECGAAVVGRAGTE